MPGDDDMLDPIMQTIPWRNWHDTVRAPIRGVYNVWYPRDNPRYGSATINRCTAQIQRAMAETKALGQELRAVGRGWSLSNAPATKGMMIDISRLSGMKPLRANQIDPGYPGTAEDREGLWMIQGGAYISEINKMVERDQFGRCLQTSGAANGQTIVGATATGTHGSRLDYGALHDSIIAIHLIAGDNKQYWLERASRPALKPNLAAILGADLVRDDDLFNAVVVGMGAFGVIQNVVIETRPRFLLHAENLDKDSAGNPLRLDAAMRSLIETLDFDAHPDLRRPARGTPHFFQPIIDPNSDPVEVLVTMMFKEDWPADYAPDYGHRSARFGPGYDFISTVGGILDVFQPGVPLIAQVARAALFEPGERTGSWGEIFGYHTPRTKVASGNITVSRDRALDTLDLLIQLNKDGAPAPLVYGCRYTKESDALLAMNKFDDNFVISIDGIHNDKSVEFFDAIPAKMEATGIPFTQHWGKHNGLTKARIQAAFGDRYDRWIAARHTLLPDAADRAMFTNDFMRERGLDR